MLNWSSANLLRPLREEAKKRQPTMNKKLLKSYEIGFIIKPLFNATKTVKGKLSKDSKAN